jgi:hypothetical protein
MFWYVVPPESGNPGLERTTGRAEICVLHSEFVRQCSHTLTDPSGAASTPPPRLQVCKPSSLNDFRTKKEKCWARGRVNKLDKHFFG